MVYYEYVLGIFTFINNVLAAFIPLLEAIDVLSYFTFVIDTVRYIIPLIAAFPWEWYTSFI